MNDLFKITAATGLFTLWAFAVIGMFIGWVLNIVALLNIEMFIWSGIQILRIIGIFIFPLGGVLGWI